MRTVLSFATLILGLVEASVCPDAGTAVGPCLEGQCNEGYTCSDGGFCCPTAAKAAVQDDLSDEFHWPFPNPFKKATRTTYRIPVVTRMIAPSSCNDGAFNCGMFMAYCAPGTQYSSCMQTHCRRTCGYCPQG